MFPYLEVTTREGIGMKRIAIAAAQAPVVGLSDGVVKAAMTDAGLTNFTGGVSK